MLRGRTGSWPRYIPWDCYLYMWMNKLLSQWVYDVPNGLVRIKLMQMRLSLCPQVGEWNLKLGQKEQRILHSGDNRKQLGLHVHSWVSWEAADCNFNHQSCTSSNKQKGRKKKEGMKREEVQEERKDRESRQCELAYKESFGFLFTSLRREKGKSLKDWEYL